MSWITVTLFVAGLAILVAGAEFLVRGSSRLAVAFGISPLVVGLTVVAFGTSAPELAVSLQATFAGQADLAVGNIIGSNISNILLILGLAALAAPLVVSQQLVRLDVPLMILASVVMAGLALNQVISRVEGAILLSGAIAYTIFAIRKSRQESRRVREQYEREYGEQETIETRPVIDTIFIVAGMAGLMLGARWLVDSATEMAAWLGISELVIGLTVVAIGTSLPELATSVVAAIRGERDIAVGNAVGSNMFNILVVIGTTALVSPEGVAIPPAALSFDLPVMIAVSLACLPIFFVGYNIARWEGALFVGYYTAYILYLVLESTQHDALPTFSRMMLYFVIPITVVTLVVVTARWTRSLQEKR